ncbi:hypothetical protein DPSP01_013848 [Paraphaeosphaeria sporulosa]
MAHFSITTGPGNQGLQPRSCIDRPATPPQPSCFVPFRRDANFVDRGTLLDQIRERCAAPASRVALVGLGGVGKSQLAIEHCYRTAEQSPDTWVFWVHASNTARLEQSFREIAGQVKVRGRNDPQADVFKLVHDWLRDAKNGRWLLVLDNADDIAVFSARASGNRTDGGNCDCSNGRALQQQLSRYLPTNKHGSVLVTSRTKRAAMQLVEESDIISIGLMDDAAAYALLYRKLGDKARKNCSDNDIGELAAALEHIPLALVQAAAYIQQRAPRCSVKQYLEEYRQSDSGATSLLNRVVGNLRRDEEAINPILITWQISFDHVRRSRQSAADLLSLMSFFDRQGIPEALLSSEDSKVNKPAVVASVDDSFGDDVLMLQDYSFINFAGDAHTFEMHRLVQLAMRKWLESHQELDKWREQFIANLCEELPTGEYENWKTCQALFPHVRAAVAQRPASQKSLKDWALLLYKAAWYALQIGRSGDAEQMSVMSMEVRREVFGEESEETLSSMVMVANVLNREGRWKEAELEYTKALRTSRKLSKVEDAETLTIISNIAVTHRAQGLWKKAEGLHEEVLGKRRRLLGPKHPQTLESMANLALTYWSQEKLDEAKELGLQVIKLRKRVLGEGHPDTLTSMANLTSVFLAKGWLRNAKELEEQVVVIRKRILGVEHQETLISMGNLAQLYFRQGDRKKGRDLETQVTKIRKSVLGEQHPDTLGSMSNLTMMYLHEGLWKEAEELGAQVLEMRSATLGFSHPDTLTSMDNMALVLCRQGKYEEAEAIYRHRLASMSNLAGVLYSQGKYEEAETMHRQTLATRQKVLGHEHLDTLMSVYLLAHLLASRCHYGESAVLYGKACAMYSSVLGENHPTTRTCRQRHFDTLVSKQRSLVIFPQAMADNVHSSKVSRLSHGLVRYVYRN